MSFAESILLSGSLATVFVLAVASLRGRPTGALLVTVLCAPAVYLALERGSQFTTADESRILRQTLSWAEGSAVREWNVGAFRTGIAILTPVAKLIQRYAADWRLVDQLASLKNVHWYVGFLLFLWMCWLLRRALGLPRALLHWVPLFYAVLLLPVHLMALKILNYDQFAVQFSVICVLTIIVALREDRLSFAYLSVACGYLGAQEKLSASPFLLLAMILFVYLLLKRGWRAGNLLQALLGPPAICLGLGGVTTLVALATRSFDAGPFKYLWAGTLDPLISWVWVVHRFVFGGRSFVAYRWVHVGVVLATFLFSAAGLLAIRRVVTRTNVQMVAGRHRAAARLALLLLVVGLGLWGTFRVEAFWHPHHPVAEDEFMPPGEINQTVLHFASESYGQHLRRAIGFHYAVFLNSIPTSLIVMSLVVLALRLGARHVPDVPLACDLMACGALAVPLAYALIYMPFGHRYMNFALVLLALTWSGELLLVMRAWGAVRRTVLIVLVGAAVCAEILPFGPAYFPFRPIWSPHLYEDRTTPIVGRLNPTWLGWGEETMLAGEILDRWIRDNRIPVGTDLPVLYVWYKGDWLNPSPNLDVKPLHANVKSLRYTANEYFLINRTTFVQNACVFPHGIPPEHVITYRGYAQAWIYRGDRLKRGGYRF